MPLGFWPIYSSEGQRPERSSEFYCQKNKNDQKKNSTTTTTSTNFVPVKLFTFLSKFLIFLFLFQLPKTFSHVLHYPNLSKIHSGKFFCEQKIFFQKQFFIFFFFERSSELGCQKNKNDQKKTVRRARARRRHQFCTFSPSLLLI